MDQILYPEVLGNMMFIAAPMIFRGPWALISSVLSKETLLKIHVFGNKFHAPLVTLLGDEDADIMDYVSNAENPELEGYMKIQAAIEAAW